MEAEELFLKWRDVLIGRNVTYTRLAADSLLLYVECEPGDKHGFTFWIDPPWHISGPQGLLLGSRQTQADSDGNWPTEEELEQIAIPFHDLGQKSITTLDVDPRSRDLTVTLDHNFQVKTFARAVTADLWHVHDNALDIVVVASPGRFYIRERSDRR